MWQCRNCGEQIDDGFDACWKCGTGQDGTRAAGFHAEPNDSAVPDLGPDREPPAESEEDHHTTRIPRERIVELCSAGNIVEADGLCELLEGAGIHARVVGDGLGVAAGGLALGENVSPRIWVHESDLARAREVIDQWRSRQTNEAVESAESETPPESEVPAEAEEASLPADVRFRFLNQGFYIAGLVCILVGTVWAWGNWMTLSMCSETTVGQFDGFHVSSVNSPSLPPPSERDLPPGAVKGERSFSCDVEYVYVVGGKNYYAHLAVHHLNEAPQRMTIHYDPRDPTTQFIGSIAPPWVILLFAALVAVFFCFVGYQFR